jgi:hypothetical protein
VLPRGHPDERELREHAQVDQSRVVVLYQGHPAIHPVEVLADEVAQGVDVLDTNVVVSGLGWRSQPGRIVNRADRPERRRSEPRLHR